MKTLPGKYFRTREGKKVGRPYRARGSEAVDVARVRGVDVVYHIAWATKVEEGKVHEVHGNGYFTEDELLEIPKSSWFNGKPRKID